MDKREIIDIKGLPVYLQADVVVCGGGTAGVFAAVAAAKEGVSVLLVEALGGLGGSAVNGLGIHYTFILFNFFHFLTSLL